MQVPNQSGQMAPTNRTNPDVTDAEGHFGWDVIAGYYKIRAEKAGCSTPLTPYVETAGLQIPPPAEDLLVVLNCSPDFVFLPAPDFPEGVEHAFQVRGQRCRVLAIHR